jgi:hypothetical protein
MEPGRRCLKRRARCRRGEDGDGFNHHSQPFAFPYSMAALDKGFHVVCEKPVTVSLDEAEKLAKKG